MSQNEELKTVKCPVCRKPYKKPGALINHLKIYERDRMFYHNKEKGGIKEIHFADLRGFNYVKK